jgi:phage anti-repressor protein
MDIDTLGIIASVVPVVFIAVAIAVKKLEKKWYGKLREDIRLACKKPIPETEAKKLISLSQSKPNIISFISACEIRSLKSKRILLQTKYSSTDFTGLLNVLIVKLNKNFPFFYIYSPTSDYDTYDTNTTDQYTIDVGKKEIRIATQKGVGKEVRQIIIETENILKLIQVLSGTGIDIEFSNGNIYIWDFFNDKSNVQQNQFSTLNTVADLLEKHLAQKLENL